MIEGLGFAMALQFKPDGRGGWLYRKDQTGAPVPATQEERDLFVRRFGWIVLSSLPLFMALMIGMAIGFDRLFPNPTNTQGMLGAIPMAVIALGGTYLYVKWFSHAPARAFAGRTPVGPATTLKQVHGARLARFTYKRIILSVLGLMPLCALAAFDADVPAADRPAALLVAMGLPLVVGIGLAWWKYRLDSGAV